MKVPKVWHLSTSVEVTTIADDISTVNAFVTVLFTQGCVVSILSLSELGRYYLRLIYTGGPYKACDRLFWLSHIYNTQFFEFFFSLFVKARFWLTQTIGL